MPHCEDFPCCGHEPGDCPDSEGRMKCVGCGKRLPRNAARSYCAKCMRDRVYEIDPETGYRDEY
jgi:hypothetical protein